MRLFVSMNQKFPVFFYMNIPEAEINEFTIRAKLMYSDANVAQEPVERCETHKNSVSAQEVKSLYVLQCAENCPVKYEQQGKHRSNVIRLTDLMAQDSPLAQPLAIHYSLGCLSSCKAMIRKSTKLVFSLERR
jgi:P53 DNA-binding domain